MAPRRFWPRALLGVRAGAQLGVTRLLLPSSGWNVSAVGRMELGPREGLHAEIAASLGGGAALVGTSGSQEVAVTASVGASLAWAAPGWGLEAVLVAGVKLPERPLCQSGALPLCDPP